jgi:hypothetical protein
MAIAPQAMTYRGRTVYLRNLRLAIVAVGFCLCPSLFAVSYTWNFTGSAGTNCGNPSFCSSASAGNSMTFNSVAGGPTVTATAWYLNGSGTLQAATLGQYSGGLGVCYPGVDCTTVASQQLSNQLSDEFILFQFSKPVDPSSVNIQSLTKGGSDMDVSYWLGGTGQTLNLTNDNLTSSLSSLGFGARNDNTASPGTTRVVDLTGGTPAGSVNAILFGPQYSYTNNNDQFLVGSMTGIVMNPEPSSMILLSTVALFAFGITRRATRKPRQTSA